MISHLVPFDLWTLAALAEQSGPDLKAPATAYEVGCQLNHSLKGEPARSPQGVAQTLLRLHRLGHVEVMPTMAGVNAYRPVGL